MVLLNLLCLIQASVFHAALFQAAILDRVVAIVSFLGWGWIKQTQVRGRLCHHLY
jgi:hypothetical protein